MRKLTFWKFSMLAAVLTIVTASSVAQAGIVINTYTDNVTSAYPRTPSWVVSSTDLINGLTPSASTGTFTNSEVSGGLTALNNGIQLSVRQTPLPKDIGTMAACGQSAGSSVTYTLVDPSDITQINVYSGWPDGGRNNNKVDVYTSTDGSTFSKLVGWSFDPTGVDSAFGKVEAIDSTPGAVIAAAVKALRFDFPAQENGWAGYGEIDVFGVAVPEPATAGLGVLGLGGVLLGWRARRRAS